jgi:hypothetical protein
MSQSELVLDERVILVTSVFFMLPLLVMFAGLLFKIYKMGLRLYRLIVLIILLMLSSVFWFLAIILTYEQMKNNPN